MRDNENVQILTSSVVLVPYEAFHVPKYHKWMESETLRELTASERLSLEEEYKMQENWRFDDDKCTFIILDRAMYEEKISEAQSVRETESMIGDVNIFYQVTDHKRLNGEVEIMIAEPWARGKGCGREALGAMLRYGHENLQTQCFTSKIGYENEPSLGLFRKVGFKEISQSDVFKEITMELQIVDDVIFHTLTPHYHMQPIK